MPGTIDPPGGFVQNSNDPPWYSSFPKTIEQSDYPSYIAADEMEFRPQHGANFLLSKEKFSVEEVTIGKMPTRMIMADRILPDLITAARASADPDAVGAAAVLEKWDRESDAAKLPPATADRCCNPRQKPLSAAVVPAPKSVPCTFGQINSANYLVGGVAFGPSADWRCVCQSDTRLYRQTRGN